MSAERFLEMEREELSPLPSPPYLARSHHAPPNLGLACQTVTLLRLPIPVTI